MRPPETRPFAVGVAKGRELQRKRWHFALRKATFYTVKSHLLQIKTKCIANWLAYRQLAENRLTGLVGLADPACLIAGQVTLCSLSILNTVLRLGWG